MTTAEVLLRQARRKLDAVGVATPTLDARLLLQAAAGVSHEHLIAEPDQQISAAQSEVYAAYIGRRAAHEPVSRILGKRAFYGREFMVSPAVLDPRADTETLIEVCLKLMAQDKPCRVLDLGTGSGAIMLTLLAERRLASGVAVDVSADALLVAKANAAALGVAGRCGFVEGEWFSEVAGEFDLIVSNPPYIARHEIAALDADVREHDPLLALDGGEDGLQAYVAIAAGAPPHLAREGQVIVEIGAGQQAEVARIFATAGFRLIEPAKDLAGHVRALRFAR